MPAESGNLNVGDWAPSFCLPDTDNNKICQSDFKGKWVVLYFYPKDNTTDCTREAVEFTNALEEFKRLNAVVLGVSADSVASHQKFVKKHNLKVTLVSCQRSEYPVICILHKIVSRASESRRSTQSMA